MTFLLDNAIAILVIVIGAWDVLRPNQQPEKIERRIAEGNDRYFEEQRAYRAYAWLKDPRVVRGRGILMIVLGVALFALTTLAR